MSDEKDPYEQQQEALESVDTDPPDPDTEIEGDDVRPGGDETPQSPRRG